MRPVLLTKAVSCQLSSSKSRAPSLTVFIQTKTQLLRGIRVGCWPAVITE